MKTYHEVVSHIYSQEVCVAAGASTAGPPVSGAISTSNMHRDQFIPASSAAAYRQGTDVRSLHSPVSSHPILFRSLTLTAILAFFLQSTWRQLRWDHSPSCRSRKYSVRYRYCISGSGPDRTRRVGVISFLRVLKDGPSSGTRWIYP